MSDGWRAWKHTFLNSGRRPVEGHRVRGERRAGNSRPIGGTARDMSCSWRRSAAIRTRRYREVLESEIVRGKVELMSLDYLAGLCAKAGSDTGLRLAA